jgi:ABC-type polar amino acid transport system ATPase subunit
MHYRSDIVNTTETDDEIIVVNNLHKYFGKNHVLKGVSTTIRRGEVVSIMGPSGGGKSTFLRCLIRLEEPASGEIYIDGSEITNPHINLRKARQKIGMVFQSYNLFPHLTALQNVTLAPVNVKKEDRREAEKFGMQLLEQVGVAEKAGHYPDQLSGGQQQRVAIARALAMKPKIMFFDEPTSALDPEMIREVLDAMVELAKAGMTMLVVSHEIGFIREASSRVFVLVDGLIIEEGSATQVFSTPQHKRTKEFLGKILQ